jgi:hypothetical protein
MAKQSYDAEEADSDNKDNAREKKSSDSLCVRHNVVV